MCYYLNELGVTLTLLCVLESTTSLISVLPETTLNSEIDKLSIFLIFP